MKLEDGKGLMQTEMVTQGKVAYTKTTLKDQKMKEMLHFPLEWIKIDESTASTSFPVPKTDSITTVQKIDTTWTLPIKQTINGKEFYVTSLTVNTASTGTSTIEWRFSSATKTVDSMKITNDGAYFLVHIGKINSSPAIDIPKNTLTLKEWDAKRFLLGLSKDKIKDITIYRVNGVTDEEVAVVKKAIQQYYGIEATVWQSVIPSSLKNGWWYNPKTKQFDGDALWNSIASWFLTSATTTRGILLVPDDMYTNITPSPYIFSRSLPKVSTVVISVARLRENGTSSPEMKKQLLEDRLTKITVRTLGVSVGLAYSEDGDKKECIFYQATTTEELDTVGKDVCPIAKVGIPMLFEKKP
jgi:predicted Zn-dependent protease